MKIITLNTWCGRVNDELKDFFGRNQDVDVFCLQEIFSDASNKFIEPQLQHSLEGVEKDFYQQLQSWLPNHVGYFAPVFRDLYGIAIFVKQGINVLDRGEVSIFESPTFPDPITEIDHSRIMQWVSLHLEGKKVTIMNVHGHWTGKDKNDNSDRLEQSRRIKDFMVNLEGEKILAGDFNLNPETKSVAILEEGMVNLIKTHNITSTRTSLYDKQVSLFADYVFVSPTLKVLNFKVLPDEVSDHTALLLDCE